MNYNQEILDAIFLAIDEVNESLSKSKKMKKEVSEVIYGRDGKLDSLGLVNFIVNVESFLEEKIGTTITIADEKAMSLKNSPFRTVESLAEYITTLLENDK